MSAVIDMPAESELWQRYRQCSDIAARDCLFHHHMDWAAAVGKSIYRKLSMYNIDCDDFIQNAELGLLDAMSRYDPERGIEFRAYAKSRVRGAVFNGLRALLRERGISSDDARYAERLAHLHHQEADSFDNVIDAIIGLGIGYMLDHAIDHGSGDACAYVSRQQSSRRLLAAVGRLPERLHEIVAAHYFNHVPFGDIAEVMGVSRGRVSQLHREAITRLRDALRDLV